MCSNCDAMVAMIKKTRDIPGSYVAYTITVPGNDKAKLIGPDGQELDPSGTPQLPLETT